jgi:hypothetical protein
LISSPDDLGRTARHLVPPFAGLHQRGFMVCKSVYS